MSDLYRILYCSKSTLPNDTDLAVEEVRKILAASRTNNARDGVTGGLFFSLRWFAQVLEGPAEMVESAFERIQCDERHSNVTVLQSGPIGSRDFPDWSMGFAGQQKSSGIGSAILDAALTGETAAGSDVLTLLKNVVVREDEWMDEAA